MKNQDLRFVEVYRQLLLGGYKATIINHSSQQKRYKFVLLSHVFSDNWDTRMIDLLSNNILGYCYSDEEMFSSAFSEINKLDKYIKKAIKDRLNKRIPKDKHRNDEQKIAEFAKKDGLCGELLLDLILRLENYEYKTLFCRPQHSQLGEKGELKNYDSLLFVQENECIKLTLGQVKTGDFQYCKDGIKKDLNAKYREKYFGDAMYYIMDRHMSNPPIGLGGIVKKINEIAIDSENNDTRNNSIIRYLEEEKIRINIPCLLFYTQQNIYLDKLRLVELLNSERNKIIEYFENMDFEIATFDYEIEFYIFPAKDVDILRKALLDIKIEVHNDSH
jgi:hypothetical protein